MPSRRFTWRVRDSLEAVAVPRGEEDGTPQLSVDFGQLQPVDSSSRGGASDVLDGLTRRVLVAACSAWLPA